MVARLDDLSDIRRILDQVTKAALYMRKIDEVLRGGDRDGRDDDGEQRTDAHPAARSGPSQGAAAAGEEAPAVPATRR